MSIQYHKSTVSIVFKTSNRSNAKTKIKTFRNKAIDDILDAKWINNKGLIMPPMKDPCLENNCQLCDGYPQG